MFGSSRQKLYRRGNEGLELLFDGDNYTEDELEFADTYRDPELGRVNIYFYDLENIENFLARTSFEEYANARVAEYHAGLREEQRRWQQLLAENPGKQEPLLRDTVFVIYYRKLEERPLIALKEALQIVGMEKGEISLGLGFLPPNSITVIEEHQAGAEWLVANIPQLADFRIITETRKERKAEEHSNTEEALRTFFIGVVFE